MKFEGRWNWDHCFIQELGVRFDFIFRDVSVTYLLSRLENSRHRIDASLQLPRISSEIFVDQKCVSPVNLQLTRVIYFCFNRDPI